MTSGRGNLLQYRLLGGLHVRRGDRVLDLGGRKQRAVLASLVLDAGQAVPVDRLVEQVWGDAAPPRADVSLQAYVSKLRRVLEPDRATGQAYEVLVTEPGGYRLVAARADVDVTRVEDLCAAGADALAAGDPATADERFDAARALDGPLLPELGAEPWVSAAAARLDSARADALDGAFEAKLALGDGRGLVADLEAAVAAHPFRERLRGHLALALYRAGRQTEALRSLAAARRTLADEIGVEPGPELRQMEADILAQSPRLDPPAATAPAPAPAFATATTATATTTTATVPGPTPTPTPTAATTAAAPTSTPTPIPVPATATATPPPPTTTIPPPRQLADDHTVPEDHVGLVGRTAELAELREAARLATQGQGRAVVISGEAGIGKSRLAQELVRAVADDMVVGWARCPEEAASTPYWVVNEIVHQFAASGVTSEEGREGPGSQPYRQPLDPGPDPGAERMAFHTGVARVLRSIPRPEVVVVDDLQWADPSTLRLFEFLAGELHTMPVLLVVTVRPLGSMPPPALVACLGEMARQPGTVRIELDGLSAHDVALWGRRRTAAAVPTEVARFVHERTGGNPFFVGEVVELLARGDQLTDLAAAQAVGVPAAAHDVVRRRVGLLPAESQRLLATASILGIVVDVDVLAHVAGLTPAAALDALDPAVEAGLLTEDRTRPGRVRFAHALVAAALAAELSLARRARLHASVVAAIETLRAANLDDHLPALVHHAREGALAGTAPQAFDYAVRAARAAADGVAFEVAASYWDGAMELLDLAHPGDPRARYDVLVELGTARLQADDIDGAQRALVDAIGVADALGDRGAARRAAARLPATTLWQTGRYGEVNTELIAALERVRADLDPVPTPERAGIVGALAEALYYHPDRSRSGEMASEAVAVARASGDAAALALALSQRFRALWGCHPIEEQRAVAEEMVALVERESLGAHLACVAHLQRAVSAFSQADRGLFVDSLDRAGRLAEQSGWPAMVNQVAWFEAEWRLAEGRYDEAEAEAREAHRPFRNTRRWGADDILASYLLAIAHDQGRLDDVLGDMLGLVDGDYSLAAREVLGWMLSERGELDHARELAGPVGSVPDPPSDWLWFPVTVAATHARAALGDTAACAALHERLLPFTGRLEVGAGIPMGAIDLALARTSETLGDAAGARHYAARAVDQLEGMGARPSLARALLVQGRLLAGSDEPVLRDTAPVVLERCHDLASDLGLVPVLRALGDVQASCKVTRA